MRARLIQRACRHHAVEHVIPAGLRACRVGLGIEERRKLDRRRQDGAFFDGQLVNGLTEVSLGCCADAVRTATEVNGVQIRGEDVVLGPLVGHLRGDDEFLHLSRQRTLRADKRLLDVLLRDGRATTGAVATEDVVTGCACETGDREARIRVEIAVLCGQNSVANVRRYLIERDLDAVAIWRDDSADHRGAVGGKDRRHLIGLEVTGFGDVLHDVRGHEGKDGQNKTERHQDVGRAANCAPLGLLLHGALSSLRGLSVVATATGATCRRLRRRRSDRRAGARVATGGRCCCRDALGRFVRLSAYGAISRRRAGRSALRRTTLRRGTGGAALRRRARRSGLRRTTLGRGSHRTTLRRTTLRGRTHRRASLRWWAHGTSLRRTTLRRSGGTVGTDGTATRVVAARVVVAGGTHESNLQWSRTDHVQTSIGPFFGCGVTRWRCAGLVGVLAAVAAAQVLRRAHRTAPSGSNCRYGTPLQRAP